MVCPFMWWYAYIDESSNRSIRVVLSDSTIISLLASRNFSVVGVELAENPSPMLVLFWHLPHWIFQYLPNYQLYLSKIESKRSPKFLSSWQLFRLSPKLTKPSRISKQSRYMSAIFSSLMASTLVILYLIGLPLLQSRLKIYFFKISYSWKPNWYHSARSSIVLCPSHRFFLEIRRIRAHG